MQSKFRERGRVVHACPMPYRGAVKVPKCIEFTLMQKRRGRKTARKLDLDNYG